MKLQEVSAFIVAHKNSPKEVASAIKRVLSTPMRIACTIVDHSSRPDLMRCVTESAARYIYVRSAITRGNAKGSHSNGKLLKDHTRGRIYDAVRRRLNANAAALTHYSAVRESAS